MKKYTIYVLLGILLGGFLVLMADKAFGAEENQFCILKSGEKVLQLHNKKLLPTTSQKSTMISVGPEIKEKNALQLNEWPINKGMDWRGAHFGTVIHNFDNGKGPQSVILVVREESMINCQE